MGHRFQARAGRLDLRSWSIVLTAVAVFGFANYCLYPGWYTFDSAYVLHQARTGVFSDQQPPAMAVIWNRLMSFGAPPGALLTVHLAAFLGGAALLGLSLRSAAGFVIPLLLLWPPFLAVFGHLWIDVSLAAFLALAAGWIAWTRSTGRVRLSWLAALVLIYAVSARHNAVFAIPPFYFVLVAQTPGFPRRTGARLALAGFLTLASYGVSMVLSSAVVSKPVPAWTSTAIWDLSAASVSSGKMLLPAGVRGPALSLEELAPLVNPNQSGTILLGSRSGINAGVVEPLADDVRRELLVAWLRLPFTHTDAWLRHRLHVARSLFGRQLANKPPWLFIDPVIEPFGDNPRIQPNHSSANSALVEVALEMRSTLWVAPIAYLLLSIAAIGLAFQRRYSGDRSIVWCLLASSWLSALPLVLMVPSTDWRYVLWPMLSSTLALAVAAAGIRGRSPPPSGRADE